MPKNTNSQIFLSRENLRIAAGNNQHLKNGKFQKLTTIPLFNSLLFKTQSYVLRYCLNYLFIFVAVCFVFVLNADPVKSESFHSFFFYFHYYSALSGGPLYALLFWKDHLLRD